MQFSEAINVGGVFRLLQSSFQKAQPFPHVVIDDFLAPDLARQAEAEFPGPEAPIWWTYNNPLEKKLACNKVEAIPPTLRGILETFNTVGFAKLLAELTGIPDLQPDPGYHGGGLHALKRGGKLDMHLDYSIHPHLKLERRLNLIVYLNSGWKDEYGGHLELWDSEMKGCVVKASPIFNRAVLFQTSDISYHGNPEMVQCPDTMMRKSVALYYLTQPRPNATPRPRARFVKRPQDPDDPELEKFRLERSGFKDGKAVY
jgi:hypothetical protein